MAIAFNCPHCDLPYKLKDELAGKRATCRNPECRQVITIPQPQRVPQSAEIEAAALAALQDSAKNDGFEAAQTIDVVCSYCDHKWTEPIAKAGKNVICPNSECRQRVKVPTPKDTTPQDWREQPKGPSLRKENFEKPSDVVDAEARIVSREAWQKGGGAEQELEPVPLTRRIAFALIIILPILALVSGIWYLVNSRIDRSHDRYMEDALKEQAEGLGELQPYEASLYSALLQIADAEYLSRAEKPKAKLMLERLTKARDELRQSISKDDRRAAIAERYVIAAELARTTLLLGGDDSQVIAEERIRWVPDDTQRMLRVNEKRNDVHTELQRTLTMIKDAEFDLKAQILRRLTRELIRLKQPQLASDLSVMLFTEAEQMEAKAIIGLELFHNDKRSEHAKQLAEDLKAQMSKGTGGRNPLPISAQILWTALKMEKTPSIVFAPASNGQFVQDPTRIAYSLILLLEDKPQDAVALARQSGERVLAGQLRALALLADWSDDPTASLDAAVEILATHAKAKKEGPPPPQYPILQLAQRAAAAGKIEQARILADAISDESLKSWAKGEVLRQMTQARSETRFSDADAETPSDPKNYAQVTPGRNFGSLARTLASREINPGRRKTSINGQVEPFTPLVWRVSPSATRMNDVSKS